MLLKTRATLTTRLARILAWNMPSHAERPLMPNLPDHPVPQIQNFLHVHLTLADSSYSAVTRAGRIA